MTATHEFHVGQRVAPFVIESVEPDRIKTVAAILQDPTPTHLDPAVTRARGMGENLQTQGALNMTWFVEAAMRFAGGADRLVSFNVRFLDNVFAGERFECTGTVTAIDAGAARAELELMATANGRPVLGGTAVIKT
ncbi:MAG TPA: MaoC family dehydratase [Solirubrobacteraceae bacterium]|nr:MaoC family dehydratase [Solirubrobacteraceae bacterium]